MPDVASRLEQLVLTVHHRNGGQLKKLDFNARLLEPALRLDSLDLAEIMVGIEKELGVSPFESDPPPRTWADVVKQVQRSEINNRRAKTLNTPNTLNTRKQTTDQQDCTPKTQRAVNRELRQICRA